MPKGTNCENCQASRRRPRRGEHTACIITTSEGDYNAQWENVGIPDDFNGSQPHMIRGGGFLRPAKGVERLYAEASAWDVFSLPLEIRERTFCLGCERLVKPGEQGLIKDPLRFGLLSGLELRHPQIKKRIGIERPFPGAFL
jgi:hypothetical protein